LTGSLFLAPTLDIADPLFALMMTPGLYLPHLEVADQDPASGSLYDDDDYHDIQHAINIYLLLEGGRCNTVVLLYGLPENTNRQTNN